jgi:serine/threonine protein kinase
LRRRWESYIAQVLIISVCFLIRKRILSRSMFAGFVYRDVKPENILRCSRYLIRAYAVSYVSVCKRMLHHT